VEVSNEAPEGLAIAEGGGYVVALSTEVTPQLRREGIAREVSRAVNQLRKEADYKVDDRIEAEWSAEAEEIRAAIVQFADYIKRETLAVKLTETAAPAGTVPFPLLPPQGGDKVTTLELDEGKVTLAVQKSR
jgi:isoleucyl-tRNA synthetase